MRVDTVDSKTLELAMHRASRADAQARGPAQSASATEVAVQHVSAPDAPPPAGESQPRSGLLRSLLSGLTRSGEGQARTVAVAPAGPPLPDVRLAQAGTPAELSEKGKIIHAVG